MSGGIAGLVRAKPMLVLSRKPGEKILIGDKISITVVRIAPGIVRIGVDAPEELPILREELTIRRQVARGPRRRHCFARRQEPHVSSLLVAAPLFGSHVGSRVGQGSRVGRVERVPPFCKARWWDSLHSAHPTTTRSGSTLQSMALPLLSAESCGHPAMSSLPWAAAYCTSRATFSSLVGSPEAAPPVALPQTIRVPARV